MESHPLDERITETIVSIGAPMRLRSAIEAERERTFVRRLVVRRMKVTGALAGVAAALGVVVALIVPGDGSAAPSFRDTLALAGQGRTANVATAGGSRLTAHVGDVSFPTWQNEHLNPTGQRTDTVGGKRAVTVFYGAQGGATIAYSIVDGKISWPAGGSTVTHDGTQIRSLRQGGRNVVVWREHGLSCVMSAPSSVPSSRLVDLAAKVVGYYA